MTMQVGYPDYVSSNLASYPGRVFIRSVLVSKMELCVTDNEYN